MDITLADETAAMRTIIRENAVEATPRLRGLILLAGTVRASNLSRSIGRSLLDLPVTQELTVLKLWEQEAQHLAEVAELPGLPVRLVLDKKTNPQPSGNGSTGIIRLSVEREAHELRGTGGVLRDIAAEYDPSDQLLVAGAGQVLVEPLSRLAADLFTAGGDVTLLGHEDGTPGAMFLVSCRVLSGLRDIGFLDFKEQVLPRIATEQSVRVVKRSFASGFPVRTLDSYLTGLRAFHRIRAGRPASGDPFAEDWLPTFAVVEDGAEVDPTATIHDSVILQGGRVERGAVVARSIVCPGGVVRAGETVAGQIVAPERIMRKAM
jgi:hypothetical protein